MREREPLAGILAALKKMSEKRSTGVVFSADDVILLAESNKQPANTKGTTR